MERWPKKICLHLQVKKFVSSVIVLIHYNKIICRLLTTGTIEEKIYQRQISKTGLSEAVVDANPIASLKLTNSELKVC